MFHPDSQILQKNMNPIVKKYNENREKKQILSKTSILFLNKIIKWMEEAEESFSKTSIQEFHLEKENGIPKGKMQYHIPEKVKEHIERMNWVGKKLSFSISDRKFNIFLIHPIKTSQTEYEIYKWFHEIKKRIYCWLYIAILQSTNGCSKTLNIYFYFTDLKKKMAENGKTAILGEINVNTAYTFACSLNKSGENEMYLYRKEEWFKVFIHESFHAFALDFSNMQRDNEFINREIGKIFPLSIDVRLYESYTEMWAEIINIVYIVYNSKTMNKIQKITEFLKMEQLFSLFQACKILKHNHISYTELYEMTEMAKMKRIHNYRETTPILAYYILKSICMMNVGKFIEWTTVSNKGTLNFYKTKANMLSYVQFIKERYKTPEYLAAIQFTENYYSTMKNIKNKMIGESDFDILDNLRMSMFEIK